MIKFKKLKVKGFKSFVEPTEIIIENGLTGIVGPNGGYTKMYGDCVIILPIDDKNLLTPLAESYQAIVWHSIVSHPKLKINQTKW